MMIGTMVAALFVFRVGIPFLQEKFTRPIWEYKPTTPAEVLHRHHRFAVRMVYAQFFVVVGFVSSLSQWAMLGGGAGSVYPVAFFGCLLLPVALSGILGPVWVEEIDKALNKRGLPIPRHEDIAAAVKSKSKTLAFWIVLALAMPWISRAITTLMKELPNH
jgi:hypothetical protein